MFAWINTRLAKFSPNLAETGTRFLRGTRRSLHVFSSGNSHFMWRLKFSLRIERITLTMLVLLSLSLGGGERKQQKCPECSSCFHSTPACVPAPCTCWARLPASHPTAVPCGLPYKRRFSSIWTAFALSLEPLSGEEMRWILFFNPPLQFCPFLGRNRNWDTWGYQGRKENVENYW